MKKTLYILLTFLFVFFCGCNTYEENEININNVELKTAMYKEGNIVVVEVDVENVKPNQIRQCGLYWTAVDKYTSPPDINPKTAKLIKKRGGVSTYRFEVFPWDKLEYKYSFTKNICIMVAKAYVMIDDQVKYSAKSELTVESDIKVEAYMNSEQITDTGIMVEYNIYSPNKKDILESGIYWGTENNNNIEDTFTKIKGESKVGDQFITINDAAYNKIIYWLAYAVTPWGTVYSGKEIIIMKGDKTTVSISSGWEDKTFDKATVFGNCTVENPLAYPITERGFCYVEDGSGVNTPTINNYVLKVEPGNGDFSGTITGLKASSIYRVRAYAISNKKVTYSNNYIFLITSSPSFYVPSVYMSTYDIIQENNNLTITAQVSNDQGYFITERGFCYTTNGHTPTIDDKKLKAEGDGIGTYSATFRNLPPGKHLFKAYAINKAGVGYSYAFIEKTIP